MQCGECFKWRVIPTQEEYEEIRSKATEDPFVCSKKASTCCDDPADIQYDNSRIWVMDQQNIPKTPSGFKRTIKIRRNLDKLDCYYRSPNGKTIRSMVELAKFLDENKEYKMDISPSDFSFARPKLMDDTIPPKPFWWS